MKEIKKENKGRKTIIRDTTCLRVKQILKYFNKKNWVSNVQWE